MSKISLNILPGLRKWFVEKTSILTAWNTTASDSKIPSEKLVKTELDKKATTENMDAALRGKIDKTSIKTVVNDKLTNDDVVGGKAVYDEIKKVEAGIPSGMKHTDITDWDTATAGFEKSANKATSLASPDDTKYPTTKAVSDGLATAKTNADSTYATKNSMRIKIGRWSDNAGEDNTELKVNYKSDGIYAKLYCDKSDFNYTDKEVVLVINGIPYIRKINETGKSERLGIQLERGTYVLTAFIRGYEGLNPATDMKIIKVI